MKFCTECGAPLAESNKFCASCGARVTPAENAGQSGDVPSQSIGESIPDVQSAESASEPPAAPRNVSGLPPAWMPLPVQPGTGVPLEQLASTGTNDDSPADPGSVASAPAWMPPPINATFGGSPSDRPSGLSGVDEDWKMSDLGPPPPPKRRLWLWIPLSVIAAVILCCLVFVILSETVLEDTFDRISTEVATDATEEAVGP